MTNPIRLEVRYGDDYRVVWSKSYHAAEDFCAAARQGFEAMTILPEMVEHTYARFCGMFEDGEYLGSYLEYPVERKRGAFLITYSERFECDDEVLEEYGILLTY